MWVLKPFSLFFRPGRPGMRTGCRESPGSTCSRRGAARHGAAWAATVPRTGNTACEVFHETRPFPFTGRQTFLLERTRPLDHGFHESRITNHETRTLSPFGSPWVRKGRAIRNPRPDRSARRPVAAFLRVVVRHWAAWAAYCPRSRYPRAVIRRSHRPPGCFRSGDPYMNSCRERRTFYMTFTAVSVSCKRLVRSCCLHGF